MIIIIISSGKCYDLLKIRNTSYGYVNGIKLDTIGNDKKYAFYGIPYGIITNKRFDASVPPKKWNIIKNVTSYGDSCLLKNEESNINANNITEECLDLNIITTRYCLLYGNCPVLLLISGNDYKFRKKNITNTNDILEVLIYQDNENIVVVEGNHRSGIIGNLELNGNFYNLSMNTNVGLQDIYDILKWIQNEITSFGGNPGDVTLMGFGDGAIDGSILLYSNNDKILFDKLISIPMSDEYKWNKKNNNENISRSVATEVGCADINTNWNSYNQVEIVLQCMKSIDIIKLIQSEKKLEDAGYEKALPFIDFGNNSFFQYSHNDTIVKKKEVPVLMIGYVANNKTKDIPSFCQFYISYFDFNNNSLIESFNISIKDLDKKMVWKDENFGLFSLGKNECLKNFNSTKGSFIYHYNFLTLNPSLFNSSCFGNESAYNMESIFSMERNLSIGASSVIFNTFQSGLVNFIKSGSLQPIEENIYDNNFIIPTENIIIEIMDHGLKIHLLTERNKLDDYWKTFLSTNMINNTYPTSNQDEIMKRLVSITVLIPPKDKLLIREISNGKLRGIKVYSSDNKIYGYAYRGIPYGLPPVGSLRFKAPLEAEKWKGIKNCTSLSKMCPYSSHFMKTSYNPKDMSEDCLYLNVYTSKKCLKDGKCPVVLYIYGGKFVTGSSRNFKESTLIENFANDERNIIFVNFNFRSGILGFLALNQKLNLPMNSNVALHDIIAVLKWIQKNIKYFGGNKKQVTLAGGSSGGVIASYLYASPLTYGLIHKVIIMSGPHNHVFFRNANEFYGRQTAIIAGCATIYTNWESIDEIEKTLDCLRNLNLYKLSDSERRVQYNCWQYMGPSTDYGPNSVMQYDWETLSIRKPGIPILISSCTHELQAGMFLLNPNGTVNIDKLRMYCKTFFMFFKFENPQKFVEECVEEYKNNRERTIDIIDDETIFTSNVILSRDAIKRGSDVFLYQYSFKNEGEAITKQNFLVTPNHVSGLIYLIGLYKNKFTERDYKIQKFYSRIFTNFIKYSNPSDDEIKFEKYDPEKRNYFNIDFDDKGNSLSSMKNKYKEEAINFWFKKLPNKVGHFVRRRSEDEMVKLLPVLNEMDQQYKFLIREISNGKLRGMKVHSHDKKIYGYAYRGIPYGLPPVGSLRFKAPLEAGKWKGIKNCTTHNKWCPYSSHFMKTNYTSKFMSEDCLYLNVYTSKKCLKDGKCPVVLYIYGGKYVTGSAEKLTESTLIENFANDERNIIFVNFNFRSGILGFLALNQKLNLPMNSNVALHDIIAVLKWIQKNIKYFGGNKKQVTLMGHSSGAVLASYLYASPLTYGLIHKAVFLSGAHVQAYYKDANEFYGRQTAIIAGCATVYTNWESKDEVEKIVECLRNLDLAKLSDSERRVQYNCWQMMGPPVDYGPNSVMQHDWKTLSKNKPDIPVLIGGSMNELESGMYLIHPNDTVNVDKLRMYCQTFFMFFKIENQQKFIEECVEEYKNDRERTINIMDEQSVYTTNVILAKEAEKSGSNVYLYQFSFKHDDEVISKNVFPLKPHHISELVYLIGLYKNKFTEKDYKVQKYYSRMFTNFIKYSNPSDDKIKFEKYDPEKNNYFNIDFDDKGNSLCTMKNEYKKKAIDFWFKKIPNTVGHFAPRTSEDEMIKLQPILNELDNQFRKTNYGFVKGKKITTSINITGYGFFGIPYASPPIGEYRFKASSEPKKWFGIRNSTEFGKNCIWNSARTSKVPNKDILSEDCLFINIFSGQKCLVKGNCSVVLYIQGGKYTYGDSSSLNTEMLIENFVSRDIVVCTINYRLGFLGFGILNYKFENLSMNSNVALFDVLQSLKWINTEIKYFGGNNNDVTVMGHSSGGMISNFLFYSKRSEKLIHKHIIMSGSIKDGHFQNGNQMYSRKIAIICGCAYNTTNWDSLSDVEDVLKCLRSIDAQKIVDSQKNVEETGVEIFAPTFDKGINSFLLYDFDYLVKSKPNRKLLIGNTYYEFVEGENCIKPNSNNAIESNVLILCKKLCSLFDFVNTTVAVEECLKEYKEGYFKILDMTSDIEIFLPNLRQCYENYNNDVDSYLYQFNYSDLKETLDINFKWLPEHANDIVYITGQHRKTFKNVDHIIQEKYSRIFANFIKNSSPSDEEIKFDKFDPLKNNYYVVDFDKNGTLTGGMVNNYRIDAVKFWNEKLVKVVGPYKSAIDESNFLNVYPDALSLIANTTLKNFTYPKSYYNNNSLKNISKNMGDFKNLPENATDSTFSIIIFLTLFAALTYILVKNCRRMESNSYHVFT
ncbi:Carboxylesterase, type B domain-containing protein [Strongyloides ratti]|uniref:Carboxylesterase, type B domain-containing protein n=1 Tax=Strongyloides ratti TaxID=34506 RepID=A0A090L461_STRRB|nr:Carboxylesterase, type B domain-containing protein [Strongyloides ratti]CEF62234.1 Carboxylesterase, type B domain-containing protein [Strongyloides ratti]